MTIENMKIVSIDDNPTNLFIIENYAKSLNVNVESFIEPVKALEAAKTINYDLVIVDYMMPVLDGLEFILEFRKLHEDTPIIMLTAVGDDNDLQLKALENGANDFLSKPIYAPIFKSRIANMLKLRKSQLLIEDRARHLQEEVAVATKQLVESEREILEVLGKTAEYRDPETNEHTIRVANYCKLLASEAGCDEEFQDRIFYSSVFHDLGKIGIPDAILLKQGKLEDFEFESMKHHARIGYEILKHSHSKYLKTGATIAYTHHEKYDGTGYPNGLKGDDIPLEGRIVAIADVFDALISKRPYKEPWGYDRVFAFLEEQKGKHFDPILVDLFLNVKEKMIGIANKYKEKDDE